MYSEKVTGLLTVKADVLLIENHIFSSLRHDLQVQVVGEERRTRIIRGIRIDVSTHWTDNWSVVLLARDRIYLVSCVSSPIYKYTYYSLFIEGIN